MAANGFPLLWKIRGSGRNSSGPPSDRDTPMNSGRIRPVSGGLSGHRRAAVSQVAAQHHSHSHELTKGSRDRDRRWNHPGRHVRDKPYNRHKPCRPFPAGGLWLAGVRRKVCVWNSLCVAVRFWRVRVLRVGTFQSMNVVLRGMSKVSNTRIVRMFGLLWFRPSFRPSCRVDRPADWRGGRGSTVRRGGNRVFWGNQEAVRTLKPSTRSWGLVIE